VKKPTMDEMLNKMSELRESGERGMRSFLSLKEKYRRVASGEREASSLSPQQLVLAAQIAFLTMNEFDVLEEEEEQSSQSR